MTTTLPRVGDTLTTAEQLDAMPVGSIFLSPSDAVWRRMDESESEGGRRFESLEYDGRFQAATFARFGEFPLRVLYVPGEPSRPSVTDNARAETIKGARADAERRYPPSSRVYPATAYMEGWLARDLIADTAERAAGRAETTTDEDAIADYRAGAWCGECRHGVVEDPPCCTLPAETTTATVEDIPLLEDEDGAPYPDHVQQAHRTAVAHLLATARTHPTRTIYSVQAWEDADGIRASWVTGYGQYTHSRSDAEATLKHQERQHPSATFRLAQAEVTAWIEADRG